MIAALALPAPFAGTGAEAGIVSPAFLATHFVVVFTVHLGIALAASSQHRSTCALMAAPWVAAVPFLHRYGGMPGLALGTLGLLVTAKLVRDSAPPSPVVAGVAGEWLGVALARFREQGFQGLATHASSLLVLSAWTLGAVVLILGTRRGRPSRGLAIAVSGLVVAVTTVAVGSWPALPWGGPLQPGRGRHPSAVLIVLDTVRADALRAYGSPVDTMPRLEEFGHRHMMRVERATAAGSWTLPTHGSLLTGLQPPDHGLHNASADEKLGTLGLSSVFPRLRGGQATVASRLRDLGYATAAVIANRHALDGRVGLDKGFQFHRAVASSDYSAQSVIPWSLVSRWDEPLWWLDRLSPHPARSYFARGVSHRRAPMVVSDVEAVLDRVADGPFFLVVNFFDAHDPYAPPASAPWPPARAEAQAREAVALAAARAGLAPLPVDIGVTRRARYDTALHELDLALSRLLERLTTMPQWSEMTLVVTSDHGEAFGEHGWARHGGTLYEELLHVPLWVRVPGRTVPGSVDASPWESIDVAATILNRAGLAPPAGGGTPFARGDQVALGFEYMPPEAETVPWLRRELRSIRRGNDKLIQEYPSGRVELYDLVADPGERVDLARRKPEVVRELLALLGPRKASTRTVAPLDLAWRERLRALGYVR
ncbi:MAG: sulfatase-like hydrolase/transferase [Vicinamibacteria bacterium]|nr:sulfatase-like hydrolase/transferase [Vicinamibacteria bacterium]